MELNRVLRYCEKPFYDKNQGFLKCVFVDLFGMLELAFIAFGIMFISLLIGIGIKKILLFFKNF